MTRPTDGRVQYRHALLRFVKHELANGIVKLWTSSPTIAPVAGTRWGGLQRRHRVPRSRRSRPRRTHRQRPQRSTRTAQHHRLRQQPIASKPKHSRCCKPCNRPRRPSGPPSSPITGGWPAPLFLPLPQRPVAGPPRPATTATPSRQTQRSRPLRTAVSTPEIIPVPTRRPGTSTAPASAPPRPRACRPPQPRPPRTAHHHVALRQHAPGHYNDGCVEPNKAAATASASQPWRTASRAPPPRSRRTFTPLSPQRTRCEPGI